MPKQELKLTDTTLNSSVDWRRESYGGIITGVVGGYSKAAGSVAEVYERMMNAAKTRYPDAARKTNTPKDKLPI